MTLLVRRLRAVPAAMIDTQITSMTEAQMTQSTIDHVTGRAARELRDGFAGPVLCAGDDRYDAERRSWHTTIDPRPAMVAEAAAVADIQHAVRVAREYDLPFAIQSTGHGTLVPADGGLLLRTSLLAGVDVDPARCIARVEPGARWSDVIAAAARYGLAPLSGTPAIGVVGYTVGGGAGWLSRTHGYAADSVVSVDVVTSDGQWRTENADEHSDLFWALRGGGAGFAAVTALEFRLYPVVEVLSGMTMYPLERARGMFTAYRDWAMDEPDELNTGVMVMQVPPIPEMPEAVRGKRVLAIRAFGIGPDAESVLEPLTAAAGEPLMGGFSRMSFADAAAAASPPPPPMALRQDIDLFESLPDAALDALLDSDPDEASALMAVELRHWGGAMAEPPEDHGPVGHRDAPFSVISTAGEGAPGTDAAAEVASIANRLAPYATGGSFLNFLTDPDRTESAYTTDDYRRLAQVKRTWDRDNIFGLSHNIPPNTHAANMRESKEES